MKKIATILTLLTFSQCVKDTSELIPKKMFSLTVENEDFLNCKFEANNTSRFNVELTVNSTSTFDIDDGKAVTITVSDGSVNSNASLTNATQQLTVSIVGRRAAFYFIPGMNIVENGILTVSIGSFSQVFPFKLEKHEPKDLSLQADAYTVNLNNPVELTAILSTDDISKPSNNLKVYFDATSIDNNDLKIYFNSTKFAYTAEDTNTGFLTAKKTITTNKKPGRVRVKSWYVKTDKVSKCEDEIIIEFVE